MIYINKHLQAGKTYESFSEMYPHLDAHKNQLYNNGFYAEFTEDGKHILVETNIIDRSLLVKKLEEWCERVKKCTETALKDYQLKTQTCQQRLATLNEINGN